MLFSYIKGASQPWSRERDATTACPVQQHLIPSLVTGGLGGRRGGEAMRRPGFESGWAKQGCHKFCNIPVYRDRPLLHLAPVYCRQPEGGQHPCHRVNLGAARPQARQSFNPLSCYASKPPAGPCRPPAFPAPRGCPEASRRAQIAPACQHTKTRAPALQTFTQQPGWAAAPLRTPDQQAPTPEECNSKGSRRFQRHSGLGTADLATRGWEGAQSQGGGTHLPLTHHHQEGPFSFTPHLLTPLLFKALPDPP